LLVLAALAWRHVPGLWLAGVGAAALLLYAGAGICISRTRAAALEALPHRQPEAFSTSGADEAALSEAGRRLAAAREALSRLAGEQAADLRRLHAVLQALTAAVAQNHAQAQRAHALTEEAQKRAGRGAEVASRSIGAMDEISASSSRIATVIAVIDSMAAQTNLLALNAAVEAARAGEHGRGFAVVAAEVRSLAARSASAAKEIKELVENSLRYVKEGEALVEASGVALAELMDAVKQVDGLVGQIAAASQAQSSDLAALEKALARMQTRLQRQEATGAEAPNC
jgi:methyl-accepting chemotaxis protein